MMRQVEARLIRDNVGAQQLEGTARRGSKDFQDAALQVKLLLKADGMYTVLSTISTKAAAELCILSHPDKAATHGLNAGEMFAGIEHGACVSHEANANANSNPNANANPNPNSNANSDTRRGWRRCARATPNGATPG